MVMETYKLDPEELERIKKIKAEFDDLNSQIRKKNQIVQDEHKRLSKEVTEDIQRYKAEKEKKVNVEMETFSVKVTAESDAIIDAQSRITERYRKYIMYLVAKHGGSLGLKDLKENEKVSFEFIEDAESIVKLE